MRKTPCSTEAQKEVLLKIKYKKISINVSLANKILDACCEHLQNKYPELPIEKVLEIATQQTSTLINNPDFLYRTVDED